MGNNGSSDNGRWRAFWQAGSVVNARLARSVIVPPYVDGTVPRSPFFYIVVFVVCLTILQIMLHLDPGVAFMAKAAPSNVKWFFQAITDLGTSGWILVVTGVGALALAMTNMPSAARATKVRRANWHGDLCFVFFTVAVTGVLANLIKNTIGRARPRHLETLGAYEFDFAAFTSSFASFPSGHSTTFGAFCACLCLLFPRWTPVWVLVGVTGGISRIMVGAHYASDVVAGLLFGSVLTILFARWLSRRHVLFAPVRAGQGFVPRRKRPPLESF